MKCSSFVKSKIRHWLVQLRMIYKCLSAELRKLPNRSVPTGETWHRWEVRVDHSEESRKLKNNLEIYSTINMKHVQQFQCSLSERCYQCDKRRHVWEMLFLSPLLWRPTQLYLERGRGGVSHKKRTLLVQAKVDIHFQNAHNTHKTAKARTLCVYSMWQNKA